MPSDHGQRATSTSSSALVELIQQLIGNSNSNSSNSSSSNKGLFAGVEASLLELGSDAAERRGSCEVLENAGLELIVNIDASIPSSKVDANNVIVTASPLPVSVPMSPSKSPSLSRFVSDRIRSFESQIEAVSDLGTVVSHINCHEYNNNRAAAIPCWNKETALDYLLHVVPLSARFLEEHPHIGRNGNETDIMGGSPPHLTGISHEVTASASAFRGMQLQTQMLDCPSTTLELLEVLPPVRLSMDDAALSSGYHPRFGRGYGGDSSNKDIDIDIEDQKLDEMDAETFSLEILPHIDLVRTTLRRISTLPSLDEEPNNTADDLDPAEEPHASSVWKEVWARKASRGVHQVSMIVDDCNNNSMQRTKDCEQLRDSARDLHEWFEEYWAAANKNY